MNLEQIIARQEEEFNREFVELHPIDGTDMFNRPPLYDTPTDQIERIKDWHSSSIKEILEGHFKKINSILNKHSKPISEGGLDYVKAFEEMEKYEGELLSIIKQLK